MAPRTLPGARLHDAARVTLTRRSLLVQAALAGGAAALAGPGLRWAMAQDASPVAGGAYPELTATITDAAIEITPTSIEAGYITLVVKNGSKDPTSAGVIAPPEGMTMDQMIAEAATPAPDNGFPPFLYKAVIPGGPGTVAPGETGKAVVLLKEGDYAVFPEGNQQPAMLKVTAATGATQSPPDATATVELKDFQFSGLDAAIPEGGQYWKVTNTGKQPHMLVLAKVPEGTTTDQVLAAISQEPNATPTPGGLTEQDFQDAGGVILLSTGLSVWPWLDLKPGRHVAVCFVGDPENHGVPHAMEGMIATFDVGGGAATPSA